MLLDLFPDFNGSLQNYLQYYEFTEDERTIGQDITAFCDLIADKLENKQEYDYQKVFDFIEDIILKGDQDVKGAAITMFLEDLVNLAENGRFETTSFTKFLGPESIAYCKAWDEFTGCKTDGLYE